MHCNRKHLLARIRNSVADLAEDGEPNECCADDVVHKIDEKDGEPDAGEAGYREVTRATAAENRRHATTITPTSNRNAACPQNVNVKSVFLQTIASANPAATRPAVTASSILNDCWFCVAVIPASPTTTVRHA